MSTISYNYDTAAIRREAKKLKSCYDRLNDSALPRVKGIQSRLEGSFEGRTADALNTRLKGLRTEMAALSGEINGLYAALMNYANALEEADERLVRLMGK